MATASSYLVFFLSFHLLLQFHGFLEAETMEIRHHYHHDVALNRTLLPQAVCSESFNKGHNKIREMDTAAVLRISYRDGPCSPLLNKNQTSKTASTDLTYLLFQDQSRVRYLHSKISPKSRSSPTVDPTADIDNLPVTSGSSLGTGNFIITVGLGTPKRDLSLVFDTGSDLTWTQCLPCSSNRCYQQQQPIFDPSQSSSYTNIPCGSNECSKLESATPCSSSVCTYTVRYGDKSFTNGQFARDTLTLSTRNAFPNFLFGCGHYNNGLFGKTAGLLGLGRDEISLVSQTEQKFGKVFSYCLPSTKGSTGYLAFGEIGGDETVKFTPLIVDSRGPSFYFISFEGISVGGQRLAISPSVFKYSGTIIDSGTVITRLPPSAYESLRNAFREAMSQNRYPLGEPLLLLDTCYDLRGYETVEVPTIVLHFGGNVDVELDESAILIGASASQVCLGFAGNENASEVGILGNKQQQSLKIVYDVAGNRLGFGAKGCAQ